MHTIYAYEQEFDFTPDDETLTTLVNTNYALSFGGDKNVHTYQLSALTWNVLSDKNLREIVVWKMDAKRPRCPSGTHVGKLIAPKEIKKAPCGKPVR